MEIKNYKEFCKLLEEPICGGRSKVFQMKHWESVIDFQRNNKVGYKINNIRNIEDYIPHLPRKFVVGTECFKVSYEDAHKAGVYIIHNNDSTYIGSSKDLHNRFREHYCNSRNRCKKTYDILHDNGVFEALWIGEDNVTSQELVDKEQYYLDYYKNIGTYNIVNTRNQCHTFHNKSVVLSTNYTKSDKYRKVVSIRKSLKPIYSNKIKAKISDIDQINELIVYYDISKITMNYVYFKERSSVEEVITN